MNQYSRKTPTLKLWVRIAVTMILSLGIILPLLTLYLSSVRDKNVPTEILYTSTINKNVDYTVQLYENTFIDETEIDANKVYIADLVKNIKLNFSYTYSGTKPTDLKYEYDITGKLYGINQNNNSTESNVVWEKNYILLDKTVKEEKDKTGFYINQELNLDYPTYKNEVIKFRNKFGMSLTTNLELIMNVTVTGKYDDNDINKTDKIILEIPLGVQAFSIKEDYKKQDSNNIYKEEKNTQIGNKLLMIICITISLISTVLFIMLFKAIFNIKPKSKYTKQLEKILKNYDQIIVEVETPVREKDYNVILVKNFEEMLDLEEELRIPIIFYENIYKHIAIFTITHNDIVYKYVLTHK